MTADSQRPGKPTTKDRKRCYLEVIIIIIIIIYFAQDTTVSDNIT